eukprot:1146498-Pelagomonas_calceolata.AAC.4
MKKERQRGLQDIEVGADSLGHVSSSTDIGETSSFDFAEVSSSLLVPRMAACGIKLDADNNQDKQQARKWPIGAWPDLPAFMCFSMGQKSDKHQGPSLTTGTTGTTIQKHLQRYQQASHTLAAADWA